MSIDKQLKEATKDWDIDAMIEAIITDDPEMAEHEESLYLSLSQAKYGEISKATYQISPIVETRNKVKLSQPKFAEKLGISVNTLRSWEQGLRKPSGAAKTLLDLLHRKPELINELRT
ncbi:type II toxin-antitoxin system MqsA family antitoxin [Ursidibacter maritimus]|uniref:Type II toxin-antitoxin system MqsA family antitoxin n=1 Tax=Ursidibacter maritimus TaxID=1331689 RepID=A0A949T515_9PAST|nr:type II toxin-antitoxin system MqsA family antitoxin [Ursidibacter maritimus]KAE9541399.1 hypothetical protein A1D26_00370 [Ursidibacter maritimus]MBV6523830.1 type II toxin-antitoxin system MqsA family antitoxin [Ursidibacter maritimus]MBV6526105.1 type II toxin-antitoxin system MqsA family antitoxin [Ursidibacter maritimus]MBV6527145.1 type II toxin-antitoxin system MqsA family antitoxin [Ursidibacter maritimus]MBV6529020.1 type II toxin-antitoxin system MqsA family antitoxin [Ursidibacte